ncbi:DUF2306 domain-containing protein [Pararhodonellum marinum]|uniref:DUF2306 domain-containing protein n=1 Tax=Pararhodonellum marinum TaxID=2755358 RepID=UPI00188FEB7D|nr:DUF2306 domain-containing protein [Pararhodonellum marinum]
MEFWKKWLVWGFIFFAFLCIVPLVWVTFSYFNFSPDFGFLRIKADAVQTGWYLPFYYLHVLPAGLVLLAGLVQLLPLSSKRYRQWHRCVGRFYVYSVLLLVAPGALGMTFFIGRGMMVFLSFLFQNLLWIAFTYAAVLAIKNKNLIGHRRWALRSFGLAFAAVTLRLYIFVFNWDFDLSNASAYAFIAWASWTLNLLVVEIYLGSKKEKILSESFIK